jgi:CheY-like chemotaxis protein
MPRILLADDSPHAQRMGERILSDEGFEVVTVSDGDSALIRLDDVDPDVVLADAIMPKRTGYEVCQFIKMSPRHRHTRVLITIGALESLDGDLVAKINADGVLKKPFEASVLLETVKPLAAAASAEKPASAAVAPRLPPARAVMAEAKPIVAVLDAEQVRAAVTIALDAAMANMIDEITDKVMIALRTKIS